MTEFAGDGVTEMEVDVYCLCRGPDDGREMVGCDGCDEWFHLDCVQQTTDQVNETSTWYCPLCISKRDSSGPAPTSEPQKHPDPPVPDQKQEEEPTQENQNPNTQPPSTTKSTEKVKEEKPTVPVTPPTNSLPVEAPPKPASPKPSPKKKPISPKKIQRKPVPAPRPSFTLPVELKEEELPPMAIKALDDFKTREVELEDAEQVIAVGMEMMKIVNSNITSGLQLSKGDITRASLTQLESWKELVLSEISELEAVVLTSLSDPAKLKEENGNEFPPTTDWQCPPHSIPLRGDVRSFDFPSLRASQLKHGGRLFDAIMMDPPWQLASSNPTRGVALGYSQLSDDMIKNLPIPQLQENGFLFIWVINAKYRLALELINHWGYRIVDDITWVKQTVNRRVAHGHGYYLQHAKETCLVALKGNEPPCLQGSIASDVIFAERRGQSQKPTEIYEYIERLLPGGYYLEIFGRRNNLRNGWATIGNEL